MDITSIIRLALSCGFGDAALCSAAGFHAQQQQVTAEVPLAERKQLRFFPSSDDERIKSLLVLLWPYAQQRPAKGDELFVDSYYRASNEAYHAAKALERQLNEANVFAKANVPYPAKEAAVRAGLGLIGHNSLFYHPRFGSRTVIILLALSVALREIPAKPQASVCRTCLRCAKACPSGAITAHGMTHPHKCLRNFMMEGNIAPSELRAAMGNRLLGCDICQRVCPMQPAGESDHRAPHLHDFLTADADVFAASLAALSDEIGRNAARAQRVRAQTALVCGNIGSRADLPVLKAWAESDFPAVKEHAIWAIEQIETREP